MLHIRKANRPYLKTLGEIEAMKEAGRLSAKALRIVGEHVAPGVSTLELDQIAEEVIRSEGGVPTFKGYGGFPGSICASINEKVVHGIPRADTILQEGDIISIDTGATVDGWVGDNAWTFPVGEVSEEARGLINVTAKAMWDGIAQAVAGNRLGDIGWAVQSTAEHSGYGVVRDYVGHGVGHVMHEEPNVPNYGIPHKGYKLKPGLVIAIEPMVTCGTWHVHSISDGWGVVTDDGRLSAHCERTIAVTEGEPIILTSE